jgi:putative phosphoesterase
MLVGICSDTHDDLDLANAAVSTFEDAGVDAVIHCGDVVAPFTATPFDAGFEFHAVRGNNDGEWALEGTIDEFGTYHGELAELSLGGRGFAAYHGTSEAIAGALVASGSYDYVVRGHTHERTHEEREGTVHLNPGGLPIPGADDTYSVATVDTDADEVAFHEL